MTYVTTTAAITAVMEIQRRRRIRRLKALRIQKRRENKMINMIKELVGQRCSLNTGDKIYKGVIVDVEENWIKIDTGKTEEIINADYLMSIKKL